MATRLYIKENTLIKQLNNDNGFVVDARNVKFDNGSANGISVFDKINSLSFSPALNGTSLLWYQGTIPSSINANEETSINANEEKQITIKIFAKYNNNWYKDVTSSLTSITTTGGTASISGTTLTITAPNVTSDTPVTITFKYKEGTITQTYDKSYTAKAVAEPQLTLSATSGSITRPKGSLSSISAVGGSDNITVTVGSTANITAPTSLTLTYATNTNKTASTPTATYNGSTVTSTWSSSNTSVAEVSGTTITAKAAGSATLTATYNGKTATYNLTVTNESTSGSVTSGWTYTSDSTNIATISGITVTGVTEGRTHITVNYGGKTCVLAGTVTVNAAPQATYYWYVGYNQDAYDHPESFKNNMYTTNIDAIPTQYSASGNNGLDVSGTGTIPNYLIMIIPSTWSVPTIWDSTKQGEIGKTLEKQSVTITGISDVTFNVWSSQGNSISDSKVYIN